MNSYEEKQAARKARYEEKAADISREAQTTYKRARSMASAIPMGQPILVDHYSANRDRNYRNRIHNTFGKAFALDDKAKHYADKAAAVGTGGISSDDPEAIAKLRAELEGCKASQEQMKAANKVIRRHAGDEAAQVAGLVGLGFTEDRARDVLRPDFARRVGFPSYALSNNNANMRRIELRIKELETRAQRSDKEESGKGYTYREDVEDNRVMFLFDGKPDEETRALLKRYAFKWSPSREGKPWVRHLNGAGLYAAKCVRDALDAKI